MLGDKIVVKPHHTKAVQGVYEKIKEKVVSSSGGRIAITVAGESGCGKSEIAIELSRIFLEKNNLKGVIFHQDDYLFHKQVLYDYQLRSFLEL